MAYISYISEDEASDELSALYKRYHDPTTGQVDNILRIHSHNPRSMETHVGFYQTVVKGRSPLSRKQREMIAVVVSSANGCHY